MRGVRKPGTIMTTSHVLGLFRTADRTRAEFFSHLERTATDSCDRRQERHDARARSAQPRADACLRNPTDGAANADRGEPGARATGARLDARPPAQPACAG